MTNGTATATTPAVTPAITRPAPAPDLDPDPSDDPEPPPAPRLGGRDDLTQSLTDRWRSAVERVKTASIRHGASLANGRLLWIRTGEVGIAYPRAAAFHRETISASAGRALIEKSLAEHFGRPTRLIIEEAQDPAPTAPGTTAAAAPLSLAEEDAQNRATHARTTDARVRSHPAVRAALKILGGEIEHIQVMEKERPPAPAVDVSDDGA